MPAVIAVPPRTQQKDQAKYQHREEDEKREHAVITLHDDGVSVLGRDNLGIPLSPAIVRSPTVLVDVRHDSDRDRLAPQACVLPEAAHLCVCPNQ